MIDFLRRVTRRRIRRYDMDKISPHHIQQAKDAIAKLPPNGKVALQIITEALNPDSELNKHDMVKQLSEIEHKDLLAQFLDILKNPSSLETTQVQEEVEEYLDNLKDEINSGL